MSDINAAPSSTEPQGGTTFAIETKVYADGTAATSIAPLPERSPIAKAGTAAVGETTGIPAIPSDSGSNASTAASSTTSTTASMDGADGATGTTSTDTPARAAPGESDADVALAATATSASNVAASGSAGGAVADLLAVGLSTAHSWLALLERKIAVLEHEARDELLDVVRQLREAL
ncbi:hypothetical protein LGM75_27850 [Burkholderia multivorans]|uniref:hypothetical protein n=1 Tax=Burkholderia multivorans TaxID=87883 RepID=UPI001C237B5B|nr:hypothetical protein [Burkholderia multivorans]MBU9469095.1 hypothetical protein [Burkholderia multivorans]MCA8130171.1 hypothetical protein [Burkholderia multivorans]